MTNEPARQITTRMSYSSLYRHRLWRACYDDLARLKMGGRRYCAHVLRSLEYLSRRANYEFLNFAGGLLDASQLTYDDLYGFLGRQKDCPSGPGRELTLPKFAVLDAYFRAVYPEIAARFDEQSDLAVYFEACRSFYFPHDGERYQQYSSLLTGTYICTENCLVERTRRVKYGAPVYGRFRVPIVLIWRRPESKDLYLTHIFLRPRASFYNENSAYRAYYENLEREADAAGVGRIPIDTIILECVALVQRNPPTGTVESVYATGRDTVTRIPFSEVFDITSPTGNVTSDGDPYPDGLITNNVEYCRREMLPYAEQRWDSDSVSGELYTDKFFEAVDEIYYRIKEY